MKTTFLKTILLAFLILGLNACEDPIDVQLEDANTQVVVDAWLTEINNRQVIKLTETQPYFDNTFSNGIENAQVIVNNLNGNQFDFQHEGDGVYVYTLGANETLGEIGDNFELSIDIDGEKLKSSTQLNRVPAIDSIVQEFRENELFFDDGIYCQFFSRDLIGFDDTYWIKTFKNDTFLNRASEINIAYDAGFDAGGEVDGFVFITPIRENVNPAGDDGLPVRWLPGDKIRVEIHSISNDAFAFLEIMRDQLLNSQSGIFAEPLANTRGNVTNETTGEEVLGVFNVSAVSAEELIIQ